MLFSADIEYSTSHKNNWGGPTPFLPMGKKYMEKEGKVFIPLSFHILFSPYFPMGEKWEKTQFSHGQKWGCTPSQ